MMDEQMMLAAKVAWFDLMSSQFAQNARLQAMLADAERKLAEHAKPAEAGKPAA